MALASVARFVALALISCSASASDDQCNTLGVPGDLTAKSCLCRDGFPQLRVVAPKDMKLKAVCRLYSHDANRIIDLEKENVSLDGYFSGSFYFEGTTVLAGIVGTEPSDAGFLWFYPTKPLVSSESAFTDFSVLKLSVSEDGPKFGLPKDLADPRWYTCSRATAEIRLRGMWAVLSETDSNGVHAIGVEVLSLSPFENFNCAALTSQ